MNPGELRDFHFITHVRNLPSILEQGILSHSRAGKLSHVSVANKGVQGRRSERRIPGGLALHDYANLYFCARNAMMYTLVKNWDHRHLCIVEVTKVVLDLPGVVVTDGNAANGTGLSATRCFTSDQGVRTLRTEDVYCDYWTHPDFFEMQERRRKRMAEVLVPNVVPPSYFLRVLASCDETRGMVIGRGCEIIVEKVEHLFFQ